MLFVECIVQSVESVLFVESMVESIQSVKSQLESAGYRAIGDVGQSVIEVRSLESIDIHGSEYLVGAAGGSSDLIMG